MRSKYLLLMLIFSSNAFAQDIGILSKKLERRNEKITIRPAIKKYFDSCGVDGTMVLYDLKKKEWIMSDSSNAKTRSLPASTFKVINMLIALETKTIADENYIVKWPGSTDTVKYGYRPEIYHDISVKNAFEVSAGWAFVELAKKIDRNIYEKYLTDCGYGNVNLSESGPDFWNFGPMAISPFEQVEFLKKFYKGELPFSKRNLEIVKKVMVTEKNSAYTIHSKTGWTMANQINTGWWIGYLENKHGVYCFATRLLQHRKDNRADFSSSRKEITKKVMRDLKLL